MSKLIRFKINAPSMQGPTHEEIAKAIQAQGRGSGDETPEFVLWTRGQYPDSTVVEYLRTDRFVDALQGVNRAIDAAGVRNYCTDGDLHLVPEKPIS